ncbi:hypothetical protein [Streptomyces sp. NPDC048111]|uniref:hypothetical protein n=1 Tax=Streptomyces sp. NPDC048111 TaxID=3365500 RepID=UPI0037198BF0
MEPKRAPAREDRPVHPRSSGHRDGRGRGLVDWLTEICDDGPAPGSGPGPGPGAAIGPPLGNAARAGAGAPFTPDALAGRAAQCEDPSLALDLLLAAALRGRRTGAGAATRERVAALAAPTEQAARDGDPRRLAALALAQPVRQGTLVLGQLGRAGVQSVSDPEGLLLLGMAAQAVGDPALAVDHLDRAQSLAHDQGRLGPLRWALAAQSQALLDLGDWHRAALAVEDGRRISATWGRPAQTAEALATEAQAAALRGDGTAALRLAERAEDACPDRPAETSGTTATAARLRLARGIAACAAGRSGEAYALLRGLFPADDGAGPAACGADDAAAPDGGWPCREGFAAIAFLADAALPARRRAEAAAVAGSLARRTAGSPAPLLRIHLRYAAAVLADDVEAETLFRRALADNLARWPWPRARAEFAYGRWLRAQRRTAEARPLLRSARLAFERIGAQPWAERAADELRAAGETPHVPG